MAGPLQMCSHEVRGPAVFTGTVHLAHSEVTAPTRKNIHMKKSSVLCRNMIKKFRVRRKQKIAGRTKVSLHKNYYKVPLTIACQNKNHLTHPPGFFHHLYCWFLEALCNFSVPKCHHHHLLVQIWQMSSRNGAASSWRLFEWHPNQCVVEVAFQT